ncbi:putative Histidine kinase [Candidatus Terasakiella magnetica]|uniref:histidine kinase n=1 Tax=Candidatus Terasakiella magnetica TaxID=1867952 RepID=A0A1C3RJM2_9PROT|nr:ATP-binding protein [Candidatus Terasakiella magnetica]SCA57451.1 putative Histidine kinase [Candidatus Terasakiella magnetica]
MPETKRTWTLRTKLLATYLLIVGVSMVVLFTAFEYRNYHNANKRLHEQIKQIAEFQSSTLSVPVWNFDEQSIRLAMSTLANNPYFVSGTLLDDYGHVLEHVGEEGVEPHVPELKVTRDIIFSGSERDEVVGKLILVFDDAQVQAQATERLIFDSFILILLAASLVGGTFVASQRLIGKPLDLLLKGIRHAKVSDDYDPVKWQSSDEIGQVITAFNDMMTHQIETDAALRSARNAAVEAEARVKDAIENISEAFVLFDNQQNLVLCNTRFKDFYEYSDEDIQAGIDYNRLIELDIERGVVPAVDHFGRSYHDLRSAYNWDTSGSIEVALTDGRHLLIRERPTQAGGRVGIQTDITEIKRAERELRRARDELEHRVEERTHELQAATTDAKKANRAKSEFLSRMSHELRTPLNGILGFAQLLLMDQRHPLSDKQSEYIEHVLKAGNLLLELINEVLDLAKIESGRISLSIENIDPSSVVSECVDMIDAYSAEQNITITRTGSDFAEHYVTGDFTRLKQVVSNLLSNAIKYNIANGKVILDSSPGPQGFWRFTVTDTGYGIEEKDQEQLFQPFNRLNAENTDIEGTGIGLTITKHLVEIMGGEIGVDSKLGEGSTFWVDIPVSDEEIVRDIPELPSDIEHSPKRLDGVNTILYVEDNPANMRLMRELLTQLPRTNFVEAGTAEEGLELIKQDKPDLVLMDINLPGMDGFQAFEVMRDDPYMGDIPVIALTANAMPREVEKGRELGFKSYLTKPIDVAATLAEITRVLEESEV